MTMMNLESLNEYLKRPLKETVVKIDGIDWRLRQMTEEDATKYELGLQSKKGEVDFTRARRLMISLMLIDEKGNRVVTDESILKQLPRSVAGVLFEKCQELNFYEEGEIESLVKKSEEVEDSGSPSS